MLTDVTIRPAGVDDAAAILGLILELAHYERLTHEVVATEESLRETLLSPRRGTQALLAQRDGQPIGMAVYFRTYSTFLGCEGIYLEDLFVQEKSRGQGVGRRLLATVAEEANQLGGRLEWSVLDWNQPSIDFYESLGAVRQSEWLRYRITGKALTNLAAMAMS